jgi:hypothetical protein
MDPSLRKTHRRIWIVFAVLLPVLFVVAILVIPDEAEQEVLYQDVDPTQILQKKPEDSSQKETQ